LNTCQHKLEVGKKDKARTEVGRTALFPNPDIAIMEVGTTEVGRTYLY
jgi:hypothetical protein